MKREQETLFAMLHCFSKTPNFREHLISAQICEGSVKGGQGVHRQVKMALRSLEMFYRRMWCIPCINMNG